MGHTVDQLETSPAAYLNIDAGNHRRLITAQMKNSRRDIFGGNHPVDALKPLCDSGLLFGRYEPIHQRRCDQSWRNTIDTDVLATIDAPGVVGEVNNPRLCDA